VKAGWTYKNLADLCTFFSDGDWIESKDQSSNGIRLIQTGNVGEGVFKDRGDKARYINEETFDRLRCTEIFEGDCLISRLPDPVGRSAILPDTGERMITAVDCTIVRFNHQLCLPEFFNYYSQSIEYINSVSERCTGTTRNRISRSQLGNTPIPTPEVGEQRRIVTLLDEAFADIATAKANAEKNLQNARELFISHLQSGYHQQDEGWTTSRIADISKHSLGKMLDKAKNRGDLKPYLRNLNVRWFDFDLSDVQEMKFTPEESDKYTAIKGDVLICEGGYPGRCAIWEDDEPIYFQKALHRVRFHNPLHSKWFVNYLYLMDQTGDLKNHFSGTGIQHFTGEALAKFTLPIPPDKQIQQVLGKANQLEAEVVRLESIYRQKLIALDDLKKSLLHQAFSGQL
jgi:type I restriction enzyme, S subunit